MTPSDLGDLRHAASCGVHFGSISCTCGALFDPPNAEGRGPDEWIVPWADRTAPNRLPPRECVGNARTALDRAYGLTGPAPYPLLIEAVDWLRRALEQMAPPEADS